MRKHIITIIIGLCLPSYSQTLIPEVPQINKDSEQLKQGLLNVAESLNSTAAILKNEHDRFWSLPDDRLLAVLNSDVPRMLLINATKDALATAINNLLNQIGQKRFANRAPIGFGRSDVIFNEMTQLFEIVPPAPEPEPIS